MSDVPAPAPPPEVRLRDLGTVSGPVELVARIVAVQRREVTRRSDGSRRPLLSGILSDGSASVRFTWWDPPGEGIERGTVVRAVGAEVGSFRGRPEITFTWRTQVGPAAEVELPVVAPEELPLRPVDELKPPAEGFRIEVRVARVAERTVSVGEERRVVHEGLLADASGLVAFTSWSDFGLRSGEALRIFGGYVRGYRGRPQLVLDERATVSRIDGTAIPDPTGRLLGPPRPIAAVEDEGGGAAIAVEGVVVGLLPPSGVIYRCPTCRRTVASGLCRIHGAVEGTPDLRARIVLDDGTGAATVAADRPTTERLWGVTLPEALARLKELPDPTILAEQLLETLLGRRLRVRGPASRDEYGLTIDPETIEAAEIDLAASAAELAIRLGGRP